MNKILVGLLAGCVAGLVDIAPMIAQKLPIQANISAFSMWAVIGVLLSATSLKMNGILKGILVSFLVLLPNAVLIGWDNPVNPMPVLVMTLVLGAALGYAVGKIKG